jgi:hypothetical protein
MLADQLMMPMARNKWLSMRDDARKTLERAFIDGICHPTIVPWHFCYTKRFFGHTIEFHHFRVGYAKFTIALIDNFPEILWDMDLEDGFPVYMS